MSSALRERQREKLEQIDKAMASLTNDSRALYWARNYHRNTRGESMSFVDMPYLISLYMEIGERENMVVEKSVQCGLSELFIIQSHIEAGERGLSVMYVLPKYELRNRFVNNRIDKLHRKIPYYEHLVNVASTNVHRVSLMHFGKGTLIYVGSNVADEFVEVPVDSAYVDEKDRCNGENLLYLPDRYSASPYGYHREISNPTVEGYGIDERYQESSQGVWKIRCPHCGQWFTPDFWEHVVRRIGENTYEARDPDFVPGEREDAKLIHTCGKSVNRLDNGIWDHAYPRKQWYGYRISKLFSKFRPLSELIDKWSKAAGNSLKTQIFNNSDLGLPYSAKGAKITRETLEECKRSYPWPVRRVEQKNIRLMGVDVGEVLHVIVRERINSRGGTVTRLLMARTVSGFSDLAKIIDEWRPRRLVIDAQPEIHAVSKLKNDYKCVWSSRFQETVMEMHVNKNDREVRMNRTALLDDVQQGFDNQDLLIPMHADVIEEGQYFDHLTASTRILEANEENPEKSRFVWVHTKPDHYFLAEAYCIQAGMLLPRYDVFDYYEQAGEQTEAHYVRKRIKSGDTVAEKKDIERMKHITPEMHLQTLQQAYGEPEKVKPPVDDEEIKHTAEFAYKQQGYVDVHAVAKMVGELEDDVVRVLRILGFSESKIKGQYVR